MVYVLNIRHGRRDMDFKGYKLLRERAGNATAGTYRRRTAIA